MPQAISQASFALIALLPRGARRILPYSTGEFCRFNTDSCIQHASSYSERHMQEATHVRDLAQRARPIAIEGGRLCNFQLSAFPRMPQVCVALQGSSDRARHRRDSADLNTSQGKIVMKVLTTFATFPSCARPESNVRATNVEALPLVG